MGLLTLVRHGQASYLEENYDKLSSLGEQQARELGRHWLEQGTRFDAVFIGPAVRHRGTERAVADAFAASRLDWPHAVCVPELDEYRGIEAVRMFLPDLLERHEDIRALEQEFRNAADRELAARIFDRLFARITRMWVAGELTSPEVESWEHFCARVNEGIRKVLAGLHQGSTAVVFTSAGVIAATARRALDLSAAHTLELSWASRNASYSEFRFSEERFSLSSFNNHPHLPGELLTYR